MKHKACEQVGIGSVGITLPENATTRSVVDAVQELNRDDDIDGILVQLAAPGPGGCRTGDHRSPPGKRRGRVPSGEPRAPLFREPKFTPCTPTGIMTLLAEYTIPVAGSRAVVVGRSIDVGRPMAALLTNADATVTACHSKTKNLEEELRRADILVSAIGKAHFITPAMVRPGAVVIDVGINQLDGKLVGDVDFEAVREIASAITPVPGGVGPMTIATLMENTYRAAKERT